MTVRKSVLITGGSQGIGRGIALAMASRGYNVAITHLKEPELAEQVAEQIRKEHGTDCRVFQGNLVESGMAESFVKQTIEAFGHLDVLVNNAGVPGAVNEPLIKMQSEKLDFLLLVNYRAVIVASQAAAKHMVERGQGGSIIQITSTRAERAYPGDGVYGGLKAAVTRSSQSMALELAEHGIRVNCVAPGAIRTRDHLDEFYTELGAKIPLKRAGMPEDIGKAVAWLASEEASYITGTTLRVDGGLIVPGMPETSHKWGGIEKGWTTP